MKYVPDTAAAAAAAANHIRRGILQREREGKPAFLSKRSHLKSDLAFPPPPPFDLTKEGQGRRIPPFALSSPTLSRKKKWMTGFVSLNEIKSLGERGRRSKEKKMKNTTFLSVIVPATTMTPA